MGLYRSSFIVLSIAALIFLHNINGAAGPTARSKPAAPNGTEVILDGGWVIGVDTSDDRCSFSAGWLKDKLDDLYSISLDIVDLSVMPPSGRIVLGTSQNSYLVDILQQHNLTLPGYLGEDGYILEISEENAANIIIAGNKAPGIFYGVQTLLQLIQPDNSMAGVSIADWPDHKMRGIYVVRSGSPLYFGGSIYSEPPEFTREQKDYIDKLAGWKINTLVYCDRHGDFFKGPEYLEAYLELKDYCNERFMEFIPSIASLRNYHGFPFELLEGWWIKDEKFSFKAGNMAEPYQPFKNLIINGGFEIDLDEDGRPDDWTIAGSAVMDPSEQYEGDYSLKIESGYVFMELPVEPNRCYHVKALARGGDPVIYLQIKDIMGNLLYSGRPDYKKSTIDNWGNFGACVRTDAGGRVIRIKIHGRQGTVWVDEVKFYRVDGGLKNVIRTETTDISITDMEKILTYQEGEDYVIIDGETNMLFDDELAPFQIKRLSAGRISRDEDVLVSYDSRLYYARSRNYNQPPCVSDERLYDDYYYPAIDKVIANLNPGIIFFRSDEIRGFNRDSRNLKRGMTNAELFSEWLNKINSHVKSRDPDCRIMIWDDMLSPYHNGGSETYQLQYGGHPGKMSEVIRQDMIDPDIILAVWWYSDNYLYQMDAAADLFASRGFEYLGAPWYDLQNIKSWSELLADRSNSLGGLDTDWGIGNIDEHYHHFADCFWNPKYQGPRYKVVYFDGLEEDADQDNIPDGWHCTGGDEPQDPLILNPSFEDGFDGWIITNEDSNTPDIDGENSCHGNSSAHFISNSPLIGSTITMDGYIEVEPGQDYVWCGCGKAENIKTGASGWHKLYGTGRFYDESFQRPYGDSSYMLDISFGAGTFDWRCVSFKKRAPVDAVYFKIGSLGILGTGIGEGWIDKLSFHKYEPPPYSCDGDYSQGQTRSGFSRCAVSSKGDTRIWYSDIISVESDLEYILSVYTRRHTSGGEKPKINLVWMDGGGEEISRSSKIIDDVTIDYQCREMQARSPEGASGVRICLEGRPGGEEYFWFDTLRLKSENRPPDYLRGDVDNDGTVSVQDLHALRDHILGRRDCGAAADVNGDSSVNIMDLQEIVNIILENQSGPSPDSPNQSFYKTGNQGITLPKTTGINHAEYP